MSVSTDIFTKIRQHLAFKASSSYIVAAFLLVQALNLVSDPLGLHSNIIKYTIWIAIAGLPITLLIALAITSHFNTKKILAGSILVMLVVYLSYSFYVISFLLLPEIKKSIQDDEYILAWNQIEKAERLFPLFSVFNNYALQVTQGVNFNLKQRDVKVSWKPYGTPNSMWTNLGYNVNSALLPLGPIEVMLEKNGYETAIFTTVNPSVMFNNADDWEKLDDIELQVKGNIPAGMVFVPGGYFYPAILGEGVNEYTLSPFFIDKYEVTNAQFKEFVDSGGYSNPRYWEGMVFIKDGITLSFEDALSLMKDSTGRAAPANWEMADFLAGTDDKPVTGISWYEAQAYAKYMGNILPPYYHWAKAAFPPDEITSSLAPTILENSNFESGIISTVGEFYSLGPYGTYDMAGNVKEWVWNIFGGDGLTMGGATSEPKYTAFQANPMPRFSRSSNTGFRTAKLLNPKDLNPFGEPIDFPEAPPFEFYKSFTQQEFEIYQTQFAYGKRKLNPVTVKKSESNDYWTEEIVSIEVGYNDERMDMVILKPKNAYGELESIVVYPGLDYFRTPPDINSISAGVYGLDFILKSGRAVVFPAWKGSLNRLSDRSLESSDSEDWERQFRELQVKWRIDSGRVLDYLESREDFSNGNIHYLGMSFGATATPIVLLTEKRYKTAIFLSGGFSWWAPPHSDGFLYLDRITLPIIMMNGEQDYLIPVSEQKQLFDSLGTDKNDKKYLLFQSGHWPLPRNQYVNETLNWLDKY